MIVYIYIYIYSCVKYLKYIIDSLMYHSLICIYIYIYVRTHLYTYVYVHMYTSCVSRQTLMAVGKEEPLCVSGLAFHTHTYIYIYIYIYTHYISSCACPVITLHPSLQLDSLLSLIRRYETRWNHSEELLQLRVSVTSECTQM